MKILWVSNAPWSSSGYGNQTRQVVGRLAAAGHDVAIAANFGLQGHMLEYELDGHNIRVYPTGYTQYSSDVIPGHAFDWFGTAPGQVITLFDVWAIRNEQLADLHVAAWCPVDHMPAPPAVVKWFRDYDATPIAMARYGEDQLAKAGLDPLYVPHSYDPTVMYPEDQAAARVALGLPEDKFIIGMVAANIGRFPPRKAFAEQFAAFSTFHHEHPDTLLYVHANQLPDLEGLELDVLATAMGIPPDALVFTDQYVIRRGASDRTMRLLYSAFDVLSFVSMGEGFGIPALEAQACGTPCIVSDFSAQRELVCAEDGLGWRVAVQPFWDSTQRASFGMPLIAAGNCSIRAAYDDAYDRRGELYDIGRAAAERVASYETSEVFGTFWRPVLEQLEERLPSTTPIRL